MGRPRGQTAAAATADASTMTSSPTLSSKAASTASMTTGTPPRQATAATIAMGMEAAMAADDGGVMVVRIAGHSFVPDHVVLRGRGRSVRWVNEEWDGCVACRFGSGLKLTGGRFIYQTD